jgi:hypothetical protein
MESIRSLIDAIAADKPVDAQNMFDAVMSQRVSERLDDYRQELAQSLFKTPEATEEVSQEENTTEEQ